MHPDVATDGLMHFLWHAQMTWQAAQTGNWAMFWQLFIEQSVCADQSLATLIFTPAGFVATAVTALFASVYVLYHKLRHASVVFQAA
jgi:hypothetical protein